MKRNLESLKFTVEQKEDIFFAYCSEIDLTTSGIDLENLKLNTISIVNQHFGDNKSRILRFYDPKNAEGGDSIPFMILQIVADILSSIALEENYRVNIA